MLLLVVNSALAASGDMVRKYKTSSANVESLSVYSPNGSYHMYVSAYGNDRYDLVMTLQGRNGVNETYKNITGASLTVDYGNTLTKNVRNISHNFVRMKLSGWGQGVGELTAN